MTEKKEEIEHLIDFFLFCNLKIFWLRKKKKSTKSQISVTEIPYTENQRVLPLIPNFGHRKKKCCTRHRVLRFFDHFFTSLQAKRSKKAFFWENIHLGACFEKKSSFFTFLRFFENFMFLRFFRRIWKFDPKIFDENDIKHWSFRIFRIFLKI